MAEVIHEIPFRTATPGSGPLIWGQRAFWDVLKWLPPGDVSTNMTEVLDVPPGSDVRQALRTIMERHDSLHTTFHGEAPTQVVSPAGVLELHEYRDRDVQDVREALHSKPFDVTSDLLLRAALVRAEGSPRWLVITVSHMGADGSSLRILSHELTTLLNGGSLPPRSQQPLGRADYEQTAAGERRAERALAHWETQLRELPPSVLAQLPDDDEIGLRWAVISSPALASAITTLALRHRISASVVVQAAMSLLLGWYLNERRIGIWVIVATRFLPETQGLVAPFNQNALLRVEIEGDTFAGFLRSASKSALLALRACEYPPRLRDELIERICPPRGFQPGSYCFFNDVRVDQSIDPNATPAPADLTDTTVIEPHEDSRQKGSKFFLYFNELGERARLSLCADPRFLQPRSAADFLRDLEWLLCQAMDDSAGLSALAAGITARCPGVSTR